MEDILGNKYSKSTISRITDLTVEEVNRFVNRPLDKRYIAIFLDGLFFYLRRGNVDKEPVIFALGIKETASKLYNTYYALNNDNYIFLWIVFNE